MSAADYFADPERGSFEPERARAILDEACERGLAESCARLVQWALADAEQTGSLASHQEALSRLNSLCAISQDQLCEQRARVEAEVRELLERERLEAERVAEEARQREEEQRRIQEEALRREEEQRRLQEEARQREAEERLRLAEAQRQAALEQERLRARPTLLRAQINRDETDCNLWREISSVPGEVCDALHQAVLNGRTSRNERSVIQEFLRDMGLRRIRGYIVARLDTYLYEAVMRGYDSYWGVSYPRGQHFLLITRSHSYSTQGRFDLWVTQTGVHRVPLRSGFEEVWNIYTESALGERWQSIRHARAGWATSSAARTLLLDLAP